MAGVKIDHNPLLYLVELVSTDGVGVKDGEVPFAATGMQNR